MILQHKHIEQLFAEGLSFVDLLPYIEYVDDICILSDGSLGKVWRMNVVDMEGKSERDLNVLITQWQNFLARLPNENFACQIILSMKSHNGQRMQQYAAYSEGCNGPTVFRDARTAYIDQNNGRLFEHQQLRWRLGTLHPFRRWHLRIQLVVQPDRPTAP